VTGAELHLDVKTVLWQETTTWRSPCSSVPSSSLYLPSRVPCQPLPRLTSGSEPGMLNGTKLCPLSSRQDSTLLSTVACARVMSKARWDKTPSPPPMSSPWSCLKQRWSTQRGRR